MHQILDTAVCKFNQEFLSIAPNGGNFQTGKTAGLLVNRRVSMYINSFILILCIFNVKNGKRVTIMLLM